MERCQSRSGTRARQNARRYVDYDRVRGVRDWDVTDWLLASLLTFLVSLMILVTVSGIVYGIKGARTQAYCLEHGYAESDVAWNLKSYCILRDYQGQMHSIPTPQ